MIILVKMTVNYFNERLVQSDFLHFEMHTALTISISSYTILSPTATQDVTQRLKIQNLTLQDEVLILISLY